VTAPAAASLDTMPEPSAPGPWYHLLNRDGRMSRPLAGPYETWADAEAARRQVERMAEDADPRAVWDRTVTAVIPSRPVALFGIVAQ
jgi:hypothetical protein